MRFMSTRRISFAKPPSRIPGEGFYYHRGGGCARARPRLAVPVKAVFSARKASSFTVSLEFEGAEEVDYGLRAGLAYLRHAR